jgi:hypothetical protein
LFFDLITGGLADFLVRLFFAGDGFGKEASSTG